MNIEVPDHLLDHVSETEYRARVFKRLLAAELEGLDDLMLMEVFNVDESGLRSLQLQATFYTI